MKILCPSKTFLLGEYAVLNGGPAILLATEPYFEWENNHFKDPYQGKGGFGASGAKFVFKMFQENCFDALSALKKYQSTEHSGSGADVICQYTGGVTFYHPQKKIEKLFWPFNDLFIVLIHSGFKINTHEHLNDLNMRQFDSASLENIVLKAYKAILENQQNNFIQSINHYYQKLIELQLTCENTLNLIQKIKRFPNILAIKGCGALGADVILAAIHQEHCPHFLKFCHEENLQVIYSGNYFAQGVKNIA